MIRSTPVNDRGLRNTIIDVCAGAVEEITGITVKDNESISAENWVPVLKEDPDLLLEILRRHTSSVVRTATEIQTIHKDVVNGLEQQHTKQLDDIKNETSRYKSQLGDLQSSFSRYRDDLSALLKKAEKTSCPYPACDKPFQPVFETTRTSFSVDRSTRYIVKCRHCKLQITR